MALYTPSEAVGDATKFANALLETLKTEYGATVRFNERVTDAELASSEATLTLSSGGKPENRSSGFMYRRSTANC